MAGIHASASGQLRRALTIDIGSSNRNGEIVDALNYQALRVFVVVGSVAAGGACTYKLIESNAADMSGATDVPDCSRTIGDTDDGLIFELDHTLVTHRYYRLVATKSGGVNIQECAAYELYMPKLIFPTDIAGEVATIRTQGAQGLFSYYGS